MAECCWCSKKLGFWDGCGTSFGTLCNECDALREKARHGDMKAKELLLRYIDNTSGLAKVGLLKLQEEGLDEHQLKQLKAERQQAREQEEMQQEEMRREEEIKLKAFREKLLRDAKNMLMNTGYNFEGYNIVEYCGIVSAEAVVGAGLLSDLSLEINDFFGTSSQTYQSKLAHAKQEAQEKLRVIAASKNANAVIGIDFDIITLANNTIVVSMNGTAVKVAKKENNE